MGGLLTGAPTRALLAALLAVTLSWAADPPRRIVSAAPSITEMLYALGLGEKVVGVTTFCHYPPEVRDKPKIGSYIRPNMETILAMKPDLVVVLREHGSLVGRLRRAGLPVQALEHNSLAGIYASLRQLGARAGVAAMAEQRVGEIVAALEKIRARGASLPSRGVMFVVGRTPGTIQDLVVVGRGGFLNELIRLAGGRNTFEDALSFYPRVPREEVYARRPEVLIDMGDMGQTDGVTEEQKRAVAELWKQMPLLPAVQSRRVYGVANDVFMVPGPRVAEAARLLFEMIHPEAAQ